MDTKKRIADLRELMKKNNIDYYLIPSSDYHQSEYVGEHFKCRKWISGFTGSAGTVLIGQDMAGLWTDGRYFIQAARQIAENNITLFKMGEPNVPTILEYIQKNMKAGETLGFDGKVIEASFVKKLSNKIKVNADYDLIGEIWKDRPSLPDSKAYILDVKYTGESLKEKVKRIQDKLLEKKASNMMNCLA